MIEAGWAETQQELYEGAQHFSQFLSALLEIGTSSALLRYSRGGQEPVSIADDLSRLWETLGRLTNKFNAIRQPELTTAQRLDIGISALFDAFNAPDSAIGQLLSYGDRQVVEYLKEAVGALTENLNDLGTLRQRLLPLMQELGDRWNRVNQVAEQLAQNADVTTFLSGNANLIRKVLEAGASGVDDLAGLLRADDMPPALLVSLLDREAMSIVELKTLLASRQGMTPILLERLLDQFNLPIQEIERIYNSDTWEISLGLFPEGTQLLPDFARRLGAPYYAQWADWVRIAEMTDEPSILGSVIFSNMERANRIHFNLDEFNVQQFQKYFDARTTRGINDNLRRFAQRFCTIVRVVTWIVMKPYSLDLREKIISTYEAGNTSIRQVAARFQVSKNTVQSLLKRKQATGTLKPAPATGGKTSQLAGFEQEIAEMVEQHQDYTLAEYCESWQEKLG
ncbi:MAG: hypothetical protein EDM05_038530 [Leptolyngbya sp. IPPAS B-1204]